MILLVAAKELVRGYRLWAGSLVVIIASSALCSAAFAQFETAALLPDAMGESLRSMSQGIVAFGLLAAIAITAATTNLAVASGRRGYALLQFAGLLPRQVTLMVLVQLVVLAVIGASIGIGVGRLLAQPLLDVTVAQTSISSGLKVAYGGTTVARAFGLLVGIVVLAGIRAAVRAGLVPPIEALREPEPPRIRMGILRWVMTGIASLATLGLGIGIASTSPSLSLSGQPSGVSVIVSLGMLFSIALTALAAFLGPVLYPLVLRAWTAVVPAQVSGAWFLARRSCRYRITQSTAAITPLMVGIALPGAMYTLFLTAGGAVAADGGSWEINSASIFTVLGPALLLAALGSAAVIFMTSRTRARDNALVSVSGGTTFTATLSAILEAAIYVATALLIATAIFGTVGLAVSTAFSKAMPGTVPVYGFATALAIAVAGFVIVGIATALPTVIPTRRSIPNLLAAEC
ncbi:MAG: hypothetical protein ACK5LO_14550 [Leucobacter sp.]